MQDFENSLINQTVQNSFIFFSKSLKPLSKNGHLKYISEVIIYIVPLTNSESEIWVPCQITGLLPSYEMKLLRPQVPFFFPTSFLRSYQYKDFVGSNILQTLEL